MWLWIALVDSCSVDSFIFLAMSRIWVLWINKNNDEWSRLIASDNNLTELVWINWLYVQKKKETVKLQECILLKLILVLGQNIKLKIPITLFYVSNQIRYKVSTSITIL